MNADAQLLRRKFMGLAFKTRISILQYAFHVLSSGFLQEIYFLGRAAQWSDRLAMRDLLDRIKEGPDQRDRDAAVCNKVGWIYIYRSVLSLRTFRLDLYLISNSRHQVASLLFNSRLCTFSLRFPEHAANVPNALKGAFKIGWVWIWCKTKEGENWHCCAVWGWVMSAIWRFISKQLCKCWHNYYHSLKQSSSICLDLCLLEFNAELII